MKRKILAVACSLTLLVAVGACKKKQEQPVPQTGVPGQQQFPGQQQRPGMNPSASGGVVMPKGETTVTLPDAVKGKWKAVVIEIEDKASKKKTEHTISLNSDFKVPNSNLTVTVGDFLPDFRMEGLAITSVTNELNNPAVGIKVFEDGKQIFPDPSKKWGWIYLKFPTIHPFEHPKYGLMLKSGVKKG